MTQQKKALSDWLEALLHLKVVSRSFSLAIGALCVVMAGTLQMLQLCAISLVTSEQWELLDLLALELEVVHPGTEMWSVQGQRRI